jgi:hypothetical protein
MKKSVLFLLLIAALGIAATVSARVAIGTLSGTVLDADGKPVDYATVTLQTSDGNHPHLTRTDGDGHFEFTRFETGQYDVRAQSHGIFSDWLRRISIRSGKTTQVTLHLPAPLP